MAFFFSNTTASMECKRIRCCCCLTKRQLPFARIKQVPEDRIRDSECLVRLNMRSFSSLKEHGKTKQANNNNRKKGVSKEKADGAYKYKKQAVVQKSKKSQRTAKKGGDKQQQKSALFKQRAVFSFSGCPAAKYKLEESEAKTTHALHIVEKKKKTTKSRNKRPERREG